MSKRKLRSPSRSSSYVPRRTTAAVVVTIALAAVRTEGGLLRKRDVLRSMKSGGARTTSLLRVAAVRLRRAWPESGRRLVGRHVDARVDVGGQRLARQVGDDNGDDD